MATFKMPTGKVLNTILDSLSKQDRVDILRQFENDVQKENEMRKRNGEQPIENNMDQQR